MLERTEAYVDGETIPFRDLERAQSFKNSLPYVNHLLLHHFSHGRDNESELSPEGSLHPVTRGLHAVNVCTTTLHGGAGGQCMFMQRDYFFLNSHTLDSGSSGELGEPLFLDSARALLQ